MVPNLESWVVILMRFWRLNFKKGNDNALIREKILDEVVNGKSSLNEGKRHSSKDKGK